MMLVRAGFGGVLLVVLGTVNVVAATSPSWPQVTGPGPESGPFGSTRPALPTPLAAIKWDAPRSAPRIASGNPLWSVPLSALRATRERPVFSSSRRPPPPVIIAAPVVSAAPPPPPPPPPAPDHANLSLIGIVHGDTGGIAIFRDSTTQAMVRLHTGESHTGWMLQSVSQRTAELHKGGQVEMVGFPAAAASRRTDVILPDFEQAPHQVQIPVAVPAPPPPPPPPLPPRPRVRR
jgi:general secretion pathway protein N